MSSIDNAYRRYFLLTDALGRLHRAALPTPLSEENLRLGLIESGDNRREAETNIQDRLAETRRRLSALALLDMCAAFESECRKRIPTATGEAQRVLRDHYGVRVMARVRSHLLRSPEHFRSLDAIFDVAEHHVDGGREKLRVLRKQRNRAAHGEETAPDDLSPDEARQILNAVLELIF